MSVRTVMIVLLALLFGGSAAVGINILRQQPNTEPPDTVTVIVAKAPINRGTRVSPDMLAKTDWPKNALHEGMLTSLDDAADRFVLYPLAENEPLLDSKLAPKGNRGGLAQAVPDNMRMVTVKTGGVASAGGGLILPGDRVDVLFFSDALNTLDRNKATTTTLLQNVEVCAIGQLTDPPSGSKLETKDLQEVTLIVSPADAGKLVLAQNKGSLHLTLRNPKDNHMAQTDVETLPGVATYQGPPLGKQVEGVLSAVGDLVEKYAKNRAKPETPTPVARPEPKTSVIKTLRGTQEGQIQVTRPTNLSTEE